MNMFDLTDRVAVVTGTAQGMGRAMATALAEHGANVVLLDRNEAGNNNTAANSHGWPPSPSSSRIARCARAWVEQDMSDLKAITATKPI